LQHFGGGHGEGGWGTDEPEEEGFMLLAEEVPDEDETRLTPLDDERGDGPDEIDDEEDGLALLKEEITTGPEELDDPDVGLALLEEEITNGPEDIEDFGCALLAEEGTTGTSEDFEEAEDEDAMANLFQVRFIIQIRLIQESRIAAPVASQGPFGRAMRCKSSLIVRRLSEYRNEYKYPKQANWHRSENRLGIRSRN
jgi:hypothetical protein